MFKNNSTFLNLFLLFFFFADVVIFHFQFKISFNFFWYFFFSFFKLKRWGTSITNNRSILLLYRILVRADWRTHTPNQDLVHRHCTHRHHINEINKKRTKKRIKRRKTAATTTTNKTNMANSICLDVLCGVWYTQPMHKFFLETDSFYVFFLTRRCCFTNIVVVFILLLLFLHLFFDALFLQMLCFRFSYVYWIACNRKREK